jgi:hypothetical protein
LIVDFQAVGCHRPTDRPTTVALTALVDAAAAAAAGDHSTQIANWKVVSGPKTATKQ